MDLGLYVQALFHWYTLRSPNLFSMLFAEQKGRWGQKRPHSAVNASKVKVVLQGSPMTPDIHHLSECHHQYDSGRHPLPPIYNFLDRHSDKCLFAALSRVITQTGLTVLTLTPKNIREICGGPP